MSDRKSKRQRRSNSRRENTPIPPSSTRHRRNSSRRARSPFSQPSIYTTIPPLNRYVIDMTPEGRSKIESYLLEHVKGFAPFRKLQLFLLQRLVIMTNNPLPPAFTTYDLGLNLRINNDKWFEMLVEENLYRAQARSAAEKAEEAKKKAAREKFMATEIQSDDESSATTRADGAYLEEIVDDPEVAVERSVMKVPDEERIPKIVEKQSHTQISDDVILIEDSDEEEGIPGSPKDPMDTEEDLELISIPSTEYLITVVDNEVDDGSKVDTIPKEVGSSVEGCPTFCDRLLTDYFEVDPVAIEVLDCDDQWRDFEPDYVPTWDKLSRCFRTEQISYSSPYWHQFKMLLIQGRLSTQKRFLSSFDGVFVDLYFDDGRLCAVRRGVTVRLSKIIVFYYFLSFFHFFRSLFGTVNG